MKRVVKIIVTGVLIYVVYYALTIGFGGHKKGEGNNVVLNNEDDSLSYAVSMVIAGDMPAKMAENGVDSTTTEAFARGLQAAFPTDDTPESRAFYNGVLAAIEAYRMLEVADKAIYPDEKDKKVNRKLFLDALHATASGNTAVMSYDQAVDYYNRQIFRSRSEKFIAENKKRPGVITLPSGVQYKIEKEGKGETATHDGSAICIYKGTYPNGAVFASSRGEAVELEIKRQVPGLAEVLTTLPAGTRCKVYIPWNLGYGAKSNNGMSPYSALVYDLEIVGTKQ